jgi:hypothetical protein
MKNKNNPKSKKYGRQSRALAWWRDNLESLVRLGSSLSVNRERFMVFDKSQIAILEAKGVK